MKYLIYPLHTGDYVNRCIRTGTFCRKEKFQKVTLQGKVNEWLEKDFSIYDNPCRREFIERREKDIPPYLNLGELALGQEAEVFGQRQRLSIYWPFGNWGVDASAFYFTPTYLRSYSCIYLCTKQECEEPFFLETCGGATVWMNGQLIVDFTPFTRNMRKGITITLPLRAGNNQLVICLDDLAERDTDYYYRLRYMGSSQLNMNLMVPESVNVEALKQIEGILEDIAFEREAYISQPVTLEIANPFQHELEVTAHYAPVVDKMNHESDVERMGRYMLPAGAGRLELFHADQVIPGYYNFRIGIAHRGIEISRKIGVQVYQKQLMLCGSDSVQERKQRALEYICRYEVENIYKAACMIALKQDIKKAEEIILEEMEGLRQRKDCSDFHLIVLLQIYRNYGGNLSDPVKEAIRSLCTGFRYWIDEPGDDVMWFFSENHALLFHICQYIAGELFPDDLFSNSMRRGYQVRQRGEELLTEWFEDFFQEFITEWNSNAYIPVDVLGLCGLYNLTEARERFRGGPMEAETSFYDNRTETDKVLHEKSKKALDMVFRDLALNAHRGAIVTSFGRSYEKELKGNYTAGTTSLLYLAFNRGSLNRATLAFISFILGYYEAPSDYIRYIDLKEREELIYRKTQGYHHHVNLYMYKNREVQLSAAIAYKPFSPGYQEHIMQAVINPTAQAFINHPGEIQPYGNGRPSFWAGNGMMPLAVQYRNIGILWYDIPETDPIGFTHAYAPIREFARYAGTGNVVVMEQDGGYIGLWSQKPVEMQTKGPCRYREFICRGRQNIWVMMTADKRSYPELEDFYQMMEQVTLTELDHNRIRIIAEGKRFELSRDGKAFCDGENLIDYPQPIEGEIEIDEA